MSLFELETIEPPDKNRFRGSVSASELKAIEDAAFAAGYKSGVDAANQGLASEQNRYLSVINEALSDQRFEIDKANTRAQSALSDLVSAIGAALAPGLARAHFDDVVLARMEQAAREMTEGDLTVRVGPEAASRIGALFEDAPGGAKIVADPQMGDLQAQLEWANGSDRLDLEAALGRIESVMTEYVEKIRELSDERHRSAG